MNAPEYREAPPACYAGVDLAAEADAARIVFLKPDGQGGYAVIDADEAMQGGAALVTSQLVALAESDPEIKGWLGSCIRSRTPAEIEAEFAAAREREARLREAIESARRSAPFPPPRPAPPAGKTAADEYGTNRRARRAARAEARRAARKGR